MSQDTAAYRGVTETGTERVHPLLNRLAAEAFGTFLLVLGIVGTALYNIFNNNMILTVALAGGLALFAAISTVGHVSGGHFNPAVSFGAAVAGRFSWADVLPYMAAQLVGAMAAGAILLATIPTSLVAGLQKDDTFGVFAATANGFGINSPMYTSTQGQVQFDLVPALLVEIVMSAVFVGVILAISRRSTAPSAAVIGGTLAALLIVSWPVSNGAMNPARSTASAILAMDWSFADGVNSWGVSGQLWLFWVAPLIGAALAALFVRAFGGEDEPELVGTDVEADEVEETALDESAVETTTETNEATPEAGSSDTDTADTAATTEAKGDKA
ncbi:MIP/aquaporin family protein [Antribacter gilvus]|uniref:MIP/aquaporin family protein n=1 Tax=Antribacter gilvus TaxID=2304675 RepID=UPI000F77AC60|nr:aquaporin [Antribacter gilvus]